jgi:hypothetical protein
MMRRVWAAVCTVFAVVAVFAVLAVTQRHAITTAASSGQVVLVRSASGSLVPVTVPSGGVHATTQSSPASGGGSVVLGANGQVTAVTSPTHPTSRSS